MGTAIFTFRPNICLANEIYEKVVSKNAENQAPEAQKYKHCLGALSGGSPPDPQTSLHFPNSLPPSYRLKICLANEIYEKVVSKNAENQAPEAQKYKHCLGALSGGG